MKTVAHQTRAAGWAPTPIHGVTQDGRCTCTKGGSCPSKGKHPIAKEWASQPFPSAPDVEALWDLHPKAQVGIRTGSISNNLIILDIDEGGRESLAPLVNANGGMPETLVVQTGSGGYHYYFTGPSGVVIPNSQGKVAPHVDIRGEGGQVVGPMAQTDKGAYLVIHSAPVAAMPKWLVDAAIANRTEVEFIPAAVQKRPQSAEEASYEANMLNKQLGRLATLQNKPWAPGDAWDQSCFEVACHLVELANSEWAAITMESAHRSFMAAAPSDDRWDERQAKWTQAATTCGNKAKEGPKTLSDIAPPQAATQPATGQQPASPARPLGRPADTDSDARMVDEFAAHSLEGRALFVAGGGVKTWRIYEGGTWRESSAQAIREIFRVYILIQLAEAASRGDGERIKLLTKYTVAGKIKSIAELSEGKMMADPLAFDRESDLLTVANGTVDLRTSDLGPHDPAHLFTKTSRVNYVPGARHPDWDTALQALPPGTEEWLQIRIGQGITGHPTWDDVLPILQGGGANGKSSIVVGLQQALGGHMRMISERALLARDGDHPTELADLRDTRLAVIEELPQDAPLNVKRLKDTLGTATITARRMRENTVEWPAIHSLFLTTNYIPRVLETDHGTWRRLALVKFPWRYVAGGEPLVAPEDRRGDDGLRGRIKAGSTGQHEAVLAWAIEGARKWYAMGDSIMPQPATVVADTSTWRTDADKIWGFLQERMEFDPASQVLSIDLFQEFTAYLEGIGAPNWSDQTFAVRLREHHLAHEHKVSKIRTSRLGNLSRPGDSYREFAEGQKAMVWQGLRFAPRAERKSVASLADYR